MKIYLDSPEDKIARRRGRVTEGTLPVDPSLPEDPHDRYIKYLGLTQIRAEVVQLFAAEELHDIHLHTYGIGADAQDKIAAFLHAKAGAHTFVVSRYLQDLFQVQDLDTLDLPAPPYMSIWVRTPHSGIEFYSKRTGKLVEASGFYASLFPVRGDTAFLINLWAPEEAGASFGEDSTLGLLTYNTFADSSATIEESLQRVEDELLSRDHLEHKEQHVRALLEAMRIYCHLLLYLDADLAVARDLYASEIERVRKALEQRRNADGSKMTRRQQRKLQERLKSLPKAPVHLLAPALVKGEPNSPKRMRDKTAGERKRAIVRGHYRMQPYGPREQNLRKRIYIAPHFSPRLEGDEDLKALITSTEYILE